ncbi:hypothetical protein TWF132_009332 [Orbilia oligospora]|nr:hypothetical protein TWF751_000057 [Orbilia oligospora]KAF3296829.1 hypothetical protein TWF132_009332 [Orbilia oligospora]
MRLFIPFSNQVTLFTIEIKFLTSPGGVLAGLGKENLDFRLPKEIRARMVLVRTPPSLPKEQTKSESLAAVAIVS